MPPASHTTHRGGTDVEVTFGAEADLVASVELVAEGVKIMPDQISGPHGPTYFGATLYYVDFVPGADPAHGLFLPLSSECCCMAGLLHGRVGCIAQP